MLCLSVLASARSLQILTPKLVGISDSVAVEAEREVNRELSRLGHQVSADGKLKLKYTIVKDSVGCLMYFEKTLGSRTATSDEHYFIYREEIEDIVYDVLEDFIDSPFPNPDSESYEQYKDQSSDSNDPDFFEGAESAGEVFMAVIFSILYSASDYVGLDVNLFGTNIDGQWGAGGSFDFIFGFTDYHGWGVDITYAQTSDNFSVGLYSLHRFAQKKGAMLDILWGWGAVNFYDNIRNESYNQSGWKLGLNAGYTLVGSKSHRLVLHARYETTIGENFGETNMFSLGLTYNFRVYK